MRNGEYIRALGRMSFEPPESGSAEQDIQTNENSISTENNSPTRQSSCSHPRWSALRSEYAIAQNDVLVTVGVCLREAGPHTKAEKTCLLMKENEVGLIVGALDLTAAYLSGWSLISIRSRIQTLRVYEHATFKDIARMTLFHGHFLDHFTGMPAHLAFQAFGIMTDHLGTSLLLGLARTRIFKNLETGKLRKYSVIILQALDTMLQLASWSLVLPLYEYSTLQTLDLAPKWPLFPSTRSMVGSWKHFMATPHTGIFPSSTPWLIVSIFDSYAILSFIESKILQKIHSWTFDTLRRILPRPNNPDQASINAALDSDDGINYDEEVMRERRAQRRAAHARRRRGARTNSDVQSHEQDQEGSTIATAGNTERQSDDDLTRQDEGIDDIPTDIAGDTTSQAPSVELGPPEIQRDIIEELEHLIDLESLPTETHFPELNAPLPPPRSSSLNSQVPHQAQHRQPDQEPSLPDDNIRTRQQPSSIRSQHRLTTLSCHPCDAAASHIADALAGGLTIGMEGIVLRSIARQFLLRRSGRSSDATVVRNWQTGCSIGLGDVYHPTEFTGGWVPTLKSLMIGNITAWALWQVTYWASTWLGVSFFQYHRL